MTIVYYQQILYFVWILICEGLYGKEKNVHCYGQRIIYHRLVHHRHTSSAGAFYKSNKYPAFKISFPLCASQPDRTLLSRLRRHQSDSFFTAWGFPALTGLSSLCAICLCALHLVYQTIERLSKGRLRIGMHFREVFLWIALAIIIINFIVKNAALLFFQIDFMPLTHIS